MKARWLLALAAILVAGAWEPGQLARGATPPIQVYLPAVLVGGSPGSATVTPSSIPTATSSPTQTPTFTPAPSTSPTASPALAPMSTPTSQSTSTPTPSPGPSPTTTTPIKHVVVIMMENRTFDNFFGQFPGANGVSLPAAPNPFPSDIDHGSPFALNVIDGGKLDQFPVESQIQYGQKELPNYWAYAQQFGLGDNFFSPVPADSESNHLALIAAQSAGEFNSPGNCSMSSEVLMYSRNTTGLTYWARPCYNISTMPGVLDQSGISWRYYVESVGNIWDAPSEVSALSGSPNDGYSPSQFLTDVQTGNLATVSWLTPPTTASDHPPLQVQAGQNWVTTQVNALMQSPYWNDTAIFITWDEWGGQYDHVVPPTIDATGVGLRVPLIVISPYAKAGYISHPMAEFSSFDKFIEENWGLPSLGQRDALPDVGDLMDYFDFGQVSRPPLVLTAVPVSTMLTVPYGQPIAGATIPQAVLSPTLGSTATAFTFSVLYTDAAPPTLHNVNIDGVAYPMAAATAPGASQVLYQYTTTLAPGSHSFTYTFSDGVSTATLPDNGVPFSGPIVRSYSLSTPIITPSWGLPTQPFQFQVTYTSPGNIAPRASLVYIDGTPYPLTSDGSTSYSTGVSYSYSGDLATGWHYARFAFDDGTGFTNYKADGVDAPIVTPILTNSYPVSPSSGTTDTVFTFQTIYSAANGSLPTRAQVDVDGTPHTMGYLSGDPATGATYQARLKLPAGTHSYYFLFGTSWTSWSDPGSTATYAGPAVTASTATITPMGERPGSKA